MACDIMPVSDRARLGFVQEETCGVTPENPVFQLLGFTGESLTENLGFTTSQEISPDRNIRDTINTSVEPAGEIEVEWRIHSLLPLVTAALQSDAEPFLITDEITVVALDETMEATAEGAALATLAVGSRITTAGFSEPGNNGLFLITDNVAGLLTVSPLDGQTLVDEVIDDVTVSQAYGVHLEDDFTLTVTVNTLSAAIADLTGLNIGSFIQLAGFTAPANNGVFRITDNVAGTLTLVGIDGQTIETETATATLTQNEITNGTTTRSFTIQKSFDDMAEPAYFRFQGCQFTTMNMDTTTGEILAGSFGVLGRALDDDLDEMPGTTYTPAIDEAILDAVNSVGEILYDGVADGAPATSFTLNLDNESRGQTAIGTAGFVGVAHGRCNVTGDLSAYFKTKAQYELFKAQTEFSLSVPFTDSDGGRMVVTLPKVKLTAMEPVASATGEDIMTEGTYQALKEEGELVTIRITTF